MWQWSGGRPGYPMKAARCGSKPFCRLQAQRFGRRHSQPPIEFGLERTFNGTENPPKGLSQTFPDHYAELRELTVWPNFR